MINFKVLTIFPEMFPGPLSASITGSAFKKNLWQIDPIDIRKYAKDERGSVDDIVYGGGAGMLFKPDVVGDAIADNKSAKTKLVYLSPRGATFNQKKSQELAKESEIMLLCGRYEGVDQRVLDEYEIEEISIGDYVLSGGELAAFVFIDSILRNIDGVLGDQESLSEESFGSKNNPQYNNLLEYPQYTRPQVWKDRGVPDILLSGHHKNIDDWRKKKAEEITKKNRPDLLKSS